MKKHINDNNQMFLIEQGGDLDIFDIIYSMLSISIIITNI